MKSSYRASRDDLERLLGKAALDPQFREALLADPRKAAESIGIVLSESQVEVLGKADRETLGALGVLWDKQLAESTGVRNLVW